MEERGSVNNSVLFLGNAFLQQVDQITKLEYFEPENGDYIDSAVHPGIFDPKDMHAI